MKTKNVIVSVLLTSNILFAQTTIFQDNFESGTLANWATPIGSWSIIKVNGTSVLSADGSGWIEPRTNEVPTDFTSECKFLIMEGGPIHISFRKTNVSAGMNRYFLAISGAQFNLSKQIGSDFFPNISSASVQINLNTWYKLRYELAGSAIKVYINDNLVINYTDQSNPILSGRALIAFENPDAAKTLFDDIVIKASLPTQDVSWIRTGGPLGGIGYDVRIDPNDPNILFASDNWAGVHKSTDGGATWVPKNTGIASRNGPSGDGIPIFCLTIDPNNTDIVWCGTFATTGVYRSTDKGEHWEPRANGIPSNVNLTFRSFCVQPGNSDVVYCGAEWCLYDKDIPAGLPSASRGKIYKTTDGGTHWFEALDSDALIRTIIVDPTNINVVYAASGIFDRYPVREEGIWKSTNAGQTWFHINNGITNKSVGHIEMHPHNANILLAAAGRITGFGGGDNIGQILRTTDGGQTWSERLGGTIQRHFTYVEFDKNNVNNVYAAAGDRGFYKSTNRGVDWFQTTYNPPYYNPGHLISIATHPQKKDWLIANGYGGGLFMSVDGTKSWNTSSNGYTGCEITAMALSPDDPLKIYVVARSSIFKSTNGGFIWNGIGNMWRSFANVPIGPLEMRSIAINPANSRMLLAGANVGDMYVTTDEGQTWTKVFDKATVDDVVNQIAYAPSNTSIVYAGMSMMAGYSVDRPLPVQPTRASFGMFRSANGGLSWSTINSGLDPSDLNVMSMAVHPTNPLICFVGLLNTGISKTTDGGNTWTSSAHGITVPDVRAIVFDYSNPLILYAGAQRGGISKSTDGGNSWKQISLGMDPEASIRSIVLDPTNSQIVYAGDWSSGVYRSTDAGSTWFHMNSGLRTRAVQRMVISPNGKYLYTGTQGEGVFRLVSDKLPAQIVSVTPDTTGSLILAKGDSVRLSISAFDINDSQLTYAWYLENALLPNAASSVYSFKTAALSFGGHLISVVVGNANGTRRINWNVTVVTASSAEEENRLPVTFELQQSYPNPFNPSTTIRYAMPKSAQVSLKVYSVIGQLVATLVDEKKQPGFYQVQWNANVPSGIYFYRLQAGEFVQTKKMILLH